MESSFNFLQLFLNKKIIIISKNSFRFEGRLLAFDNHLNLVISEAEEYIENSKQNLDDHRRIVKRILGLMIIRGSEISYFIIE